MKLFFKKFILAIMIVPLISIVTNIYIGGGIAYAAEPTVRLQKTFTSDTRVKEIKKGGNGRLYFGEDGRVYFGYEKENNVVYAETGAILTPKELILEDDEIIKDIAGYEDNVFIFTENGDVYARGDNSTGLIGLDEFKLYNKFTKITSVPNIVDVKMSEFGTWFITEDEVYAVGENTYGQLGVGHRNIVTVPEKVIGVSNVKQIENYTAANYNGVLPYETYFLTQEGEVYACGTGFLGDGTTIVGYPNSVLTQPYHAEPICITENIEEKVNKIVIGGLWTKIMQTDTKTYIWGGVHTIKVIKSPLEVELLNGENIIDVQQEKRVGSNYGHTVIRDYCITDSGRLYVSGQNGVKKIADVDFTLNIADNMVWVKDGELYEYSNTQEKSIKIDVPYVKQLGVSYWKLSDEYSGSYTYVVDTIDGLYSVHYIHDSKSYNQVKTITKLFNYNISLEQITPNVWVSSSGEAYFFENRYGTMVDGKRMDVKIDYYKDGYYYDFNGGIYFFRESAENAVYNTDYFFRRELRRIGIDPWPRKEGVIIDDLDSSATVRYAFSTSDTYEGVTSDEWEYYDKNSGRILLNPQASGIYYIHFEIAQDDTIYKYVFGPYIVQLHGDTVVSNTGRTDYAYISADMRIPDEMSATFNLIFTPPQDIFLTNSLSSDPDRMFFGIIRNGNINIKAYDPAGNDISDKLDMGYVTEIYKNGTFVGHVSDNYLFTKRDPGAVSDNVYILKLGVGGIFKGVGNRYRLEFNGMSGYDSVTMQTLVPINTHKFTIDVYVTELPSLS